MSRGRKRGSSLLELLCAMTLFALVASAVGALTTGSMVHTVGNRHATLAALLAQQELEDLRGLAYADVAQRSSTRTMEGQAFRVATAVRADSPAAGMKDITVTVTWAGAEGARSYALETIFTDITS